MRLRGSIAPLAAAVLLSSCTDRGGEHLPIGAECVAIFESELDCGNDAMCGLAGDGRHVCMAYCEDLLEDGHQAPCGDGTWCTPTMPTAAFHPEHGAACYVGGDVAIGAGCDPDRQDCVSDARCDRNPRAAPDAEHVCVRLCVADGSTGVDACAVGERCVHGRCAPPCDPPGTCRDGFVCSHGECRDARQLADCSYDRVPDCPLGQVCVCATLGACDGGFRCIEPTP